MTTPRRLTAPSIAAIAVVAMLAMTAGAQGSAPATDPGTPTSSTAPTGPTGATPAPLTATLSACHPDALSANRYAIFASQTLAAPVPGTQVMAVDFTLEQRTAAGGFGTVKAPGFGVWVPSQPRVGIFTYSHEVTALPAPGAFRVIVRARWLGRHRRLLHVASVLSPVCLQPLLAPDLALGRITSSAGATAATAQYSVEVRNLGSAAAGAFEVTLSVGGTALAPVTIAGLAADGSTAAVFTGPNCSAGMTLVAVADPSGAIVEPADSKRTRTTGCLLARA